MALLSALLCLAPGGPASAVEGADDSAARRTTVYLAGDSTVASYSESVRPMAGWGQMIGQFFTGEVEFENRALGGRSSRSFVLESHLDRILATINRGDYLFVQFGHNDKPLTDSLCASKPLYCNRHTEPCTTYKRYLAKYVDGARAHGATPVLITPMGTRKFDRKGRFVNEFSDYAKAMRQLGAERKAPVIDLNARSIAFYNRIGVQASKDVFLHVAPRTYPAYPSGKADNVHFQEYGAARLARMVAEDVRRSDLPIGRYVATP
ncbi:rhamnogalacturonan acetylesterase [Streptomyces sp. A3M-1-3]|uniref:rhamnogalacturonan acetylesterase n=1 Tax=Streptomyces sp. A3M-1-3 TaxID=2962044 RepID=UPI0020B7C713|nr:rhamnogalacturonan acetylesterase [Streptomyces sp. A3M-1-3]MCP3819732.1 rhamnogalacturonan acetylesterase [Streptomyces sp. A3M-1-3]